LGARRAVRPQQLERVLQFAEHAGGAEQQHAKPATLAAMPCDGSFALARACAARGALRADDGRDWLSRPCSSTSRSIHHPSRPTMASSRAPGSGCRRRTWPRSCACRRRRSTGRARAPAEGGAEPRASAGMGRSGHAAAWRAARAYRRAARVGS
jgi:hypothetical protein